jgi:hypothetical protein
MGRKIIYTDWPLVEDVRPIEVRTNQSFAANTHTETTISGTAMTKAYHKASYYQATMSMQAKMIF